MTDNKHTPGPWYPAHLADDDCSCDCRSIVSGGYAGSICIISVNNGIASISEGGNDCPPLEEAKANARIIAAAPDLLEALELMVDIYDPDGLDICAATDARLAIAKAKGE